MFFENTARTYGLDLQTPWAGRDVFKANEVTRGYVDLFGNVGSAGGSLLEGLVVLWGTEVCYAEAWAYAKRCGSETARGSGIGVGGGNGGAGERGEDAHANEALRNEFIPNWTSAEFKAFVDEIGELVDEVATEEGVFADGDEEGKRKVRRCEEVWEQVLWLEERFWPSMVSG